MDAIDVHNQSTQDLAQDELGLNQSQLGSIPNFDEPVQKLRSELNSDLNKTRSKVRSARQTLESYHQEESSIIERLDKLSRKKDFYKSEMEQVLGRLRTKCSDDYDLRQCFSTKSAFEDKLKTYQGTYISSVGYYLFLKDAFETLCADELKTRECKSSVRGNIQKTIEEISTLEKMIQDEEWVLSHIHEKFPKRGKIPGSSNESGQESGPESR